jgi:hypothetical protein
VHIYVYLPHAWTVHDSFIHEAGRFLSLQGQVEEGTYDELKAAARRTGDAAKEWMAGSATTGSTVYKAAKEDKEKLYMGTKRAVEDGLGQTHPNLGNEG